MFKANISAHFDPRPNPSVSWDGGLEERHRNADNEAKTAMKRACRVLADSCRRARYASIVVATVIAVVSSPSGARAAESCPNESVRVGPSAALPDCRAYELVSPLGSEPQRPITHDSPVSLTGDRIGFYTEFGPAPGFAGASPGPYYLSTRGAAGWSTADEIPPQSTSSGLFCSAVVAGYSADLFRAILSDGWNWTGYPRHPDNRGATSSCGHDEPLLVGGEGQGAQNIFSHDTGAPNEAGFYQLLNPTPLGMGARDAYFQAGSADLSHVVFTSPLQLTPEAPLPPERTTHYSVGEDLYESVGGTIHLVTILPGGVPTWGILANGWESNSAPTSASFTHAVSEDGERVFFYGHGEQYCEEKLSGATGTECRAEGAYLNANLYLRESVAQEASAGGQCSPAEPGRACTVQVDKRNSDAPPGPDGGGTFQWATPDGSRAFFTDCARLTADATAVASGGCGGFAKEQNSYEQPTGNDLYEYDAGKPAGHRLTDLTVDTNGSDSLGADMQGVAGISRDGSYVYFVARGVLSGAEENARHEKAATGETNLYVRHAGATAFIATLGPSISGEAPGVKEEIEVCDWASAKTPEWNPGTNPRGSGEPCLTSRVSSDGRFLAFNSHRSLTGYDSTVAATGKPSFEIFRYDASEKVLSCASCDPAGDPPTAAETFQQPSILPPLLTGEGWQFEAQVMPSQLADDGKVFFSTTDSLLPADVGHGNFDVYEFDGSHLYLLSKGAASDESLFNNASPSGNDVFFTTSAALVGGDTDSATSLYDARVGGGFAEPSTPAPACDESTVACRAPAPSAPPGSSPGSATFAGPGNSVILPTSPPPPPKPFHCRKGFRKLRVHGHNVCRRVRKKHKTSTHHSSRGAHR
jgi:hypothetical protein